MILGNCQPDTRDFFYIRPHSVLKIIVYQVTRNFGYYPTLWVYPKLQVNPKIWVTQNIGCNRTSLVISGTS